MDVQHQHTRARGVFVTMGSLMAELPAARLSDYCATKAATAQLHECLRWELQQGTQGTPCDVRCLHEAAASSPSARALCGGDATRLAAGRA